MSNLCVLFVYGLFGYSGLWIFCEGLWENVSGRLQISPEVSCLFIGFHPILHRLQKCISICCGF